MDKRKLIKNSLHKNKQSINQSLERINSIGDVQSSSCSSNIMMGKEKSDSFQERKLSDIRSSTLKSLNIYSRERNDPSVKNRKRSFCESEYDISKTDDLAVTSKILKVKSSISKQFDSQAQLANTSYTLSQQENMHLSRNSTSMTNKFLDTANPSMEKSIAQKPKITNPNSSEERDSDDPDLSHNEYNVRRQKLNKTILDRNTKHISISHNSSLSGKMCQKSSNETIARPTSQRKQDKPQEFQLSIESEKHTINNKEYISEKQNFHVSSVFSNFLQKCGIVLSTDGIHTLSKFLYHTYLFILFFN